MSVTNLAPGQVKRVIDRGDAVTLLDVRTEDEYDSRHIPGVTLIPLHDLPSRLGELNAGLPVIVICEHGIRSANGARFLVSEGFTDVAHMVGGMAQWTGSVEP